MSKIIKPPSYVNSMNLAHAMSRDAKLRWMINEHQALTLHDSTRHNNTGVLTSVVANGNVDLDGAEDLVTSTRVPVTDWSLAVIYTPDTVSGLHCIYDQGDIYLSQSGTDLVYGFADSGGSDIISTASSVLTAGTSVDIMITKYGSVHTIYVDGLQQDTFSDATSPDTSQTSCIVGRRVSPGVSYVALTPANLTAEKGVNGKLEYSSLSDSLNSANVCELLSSYTGSIHAWIKPSWASTDTDDHYVCDFGSVKLFWDGSETKWTGTVNSVNVTVTDSFSANDWIYLILTWDSNAPTLDITADATAGAQVTSAHTVASPASTLYVGSDSAGANTLSGPESIRIAGIIESSFYDSGDGDVDMYVVDPGAVMFDFSDAASGLHYWHSGKTVSAIADGPNDDTLTTAAGADNSFADGDAVVVSDGTGHSILAYVDGTPTDTQVVVDDGAGADAGEVELVGVFPDLDGDSQYFYRTDADFPESGITGDLTIQAWIKPAAVSGINGILAKYDVSGNLRMYSFYLSDDNMVFLVSVDGSAQVIVTTSANNLVAGTWQHIGVVYDASAGTADFYFNGIWFEQETGLPNSIADKAPDCYVGTLSTQANLYGFQGGLHNIALFDDKRTPAEILASATDPNEDLSGEGNIIGQWMFNEGAAANFIDNTQGDAGRDLIPYDGGDVTFENCGRTQEAYVSRNLHHDPGAEAGGIGGITVGSNWTVTKDTSEVHADAQSLKLVAAAADDNDECILAAPVLANGDDYWNRLWIFPSAIHDNSKLYLDVDGAGVAFSREVGKSLGDNGEFARSFDLDATYYAQAANNTVLDIGLQDIGIAAWVNVNSGSPALQMILEKFGTKSVGPGYQFAIISGVVRVYIQDGADYYYIDGNTDIRDNRWHYITGIIDRDNAANCKIYLDRVEDGTTNKTGTVGDVGTITNTGILLLGIDVDISPLTGELRDLVLSYPADIMAANEMGAAGEIANLYNNPGDPSQWPNSEDYWLCNDNAGNTTVVGANNNLTASGNTNVFATENWKMYEQCFEGDQDGAHNFNLRITGAGGGTNTATVYVDNGEIREDLVVNPGCEGGADPPASWTQETNATVVSDTSPHSGTNCLKTTAGAVNVGARQNVTLVDAKYYTIIGWAKATAGDTAEITVDTGDTSTINAGTVTATTWTQIKATFLSTGTSGVIYLRGQANGDIVWFDDLMLTILDSADATSAGGTNDFADGKIHDVGVWSRALRLEEAKRHSDFPYETIE